MIRQAEISDLEEIRVLLVDAHKRSRFFEKPISENIVNKILRRSIQTKFIYSKVGVKNSHVEGILFGRLEPYWFSTQKAVTDTFFYTSELGHGLGFPLITDFFKWAEGKKKDGVWELVLEISSGFSSDEQTEKLYRKVAERRGLPFKQIGSLFSARL